MKFSRGLNSTEFGPCFESQGNKLSRNWISDFTPGNNFSRISCTVVENNKNESHVVVSSNVIKSSKSFFAGVRFLRDLILAEGSEKIREIREN